MPLPCYNGARKRSAAMAAALFHVQRSNARRSPLAPFARASSRSEATRRSVAARSSISGSSHHPSAASVSPRNSPRSARRSAGTRYATSLSRKSSAAPARSRDHRQPTHHRLEHRKTETLAAIRKRERITAPVDTDDLLAAHVIVQDDQLGRVRILREGSERRAVVRERVERACPEDLEHKRDVVVAPKCAPICGEARSRRP